MQGATGLSSHSYIFEQGFAVECCLLTMLIQPYEPHELQFAYCYRVYFRWQTSHRRPYPPLATLTRKELDALARWYEIRILELTCNNTELLTIVSLRPDESISTCASKLKGQVSKWLRDKLRLTVPTKLLSRGYFACTVGKSKARVIERYLDRQGAHHGYANRSLPPILVQQYGLTEQDEQRLAVRHARVIARFHIVLSTQKRRGVLGSQEAGKIAAEWLKVQIELRTAIIKLSFVPDHVHLAVRIHPTVSPPNVIAALMNVAQDTIQASLIQAGLNRLWERTVYLGSYGDLSSPEVMKYLKNFRFDE